ncbi:DUF4397 domain-containing protein [Flavihumibacter fluvii]|uniref:DUF4397 domain-containing protein n=1 Tax=Flavihumibacter fluvii TaxID=2838157 RepID=UPI001BDEE4A9|nr:DUF4397 domain-containing protein [Flavihumibacter fluvii]ULQ54455.1 DUF4397 domain-containing protein [Flavihumibacter fluvii]
MKRIFFLALSSMAFISCGKQGDDTANGPKAKITIINAALDAGAVTLVFDGQNVNETPIAFGQFSGSADNAYLAARPGVQLTQWQVGSTPPAEGKFFQWVPGAYYTLVQYDTAVQNIAPVLLVKDNITVNDTMAKGRFINCVAGIDSLSLWLVGPTDTVKVATKNAYIGISGSFLTEFSISWKPGARRMELIDKNGVVLYAEDIDIAEKTNYSFVAFGETGGIGEKAPVARKMAQLQ